MANPEWGAKHICHSCGTRYYDLRRSPIICPKCNIEYDPEAFLKSRRTRAAAVEELPVAKPAAKGKTDAVESADEVEEVAEVELDADSDTVALDELDEADSTTASVPTVDDDDDDDDDDADVLLEDASELDDDDVGAVVDIAKDDDPNA